MREVSLAGVYLDVPVFSQPGEHLVCLSDAERGLKRGSGGRYFPAPHPHNSAAAQSAASFFGSSVGLSIPRLLSTIFSTVAGNGCDPWRATHSAGPLLGRPSTP